MRRPTRRSVLAALAALPTAGCLTDTGSESPESSTDATTTHDRTTADGTTAADPTTTGDWFTHVSNEAEPDHSITLNNESSEARTVRVWVTREETGETIFEETRESPPGTEYELYNLQQADPDGVESFAVCGEFVDADFTTDADGESDARHCVTLRTDACHGNAHVTVLDDGSLQVIYSIC